ncbi:hypothetical protein R0K17_02855 [Planococcus sp. SIMBA_143]
MGLRRPDEVTSVFDNSSTYGENDEVVDEFFGNTAVNKYLREGDHVTVWTETEGSNKKKPGQIISEKRYPIIGYLFS